jgi:hypothetical protein
MWHQQCPPFSCWFGKVCEQKIALTIRAAILHLEHSKGTQSDWLLAFTISNIGLEGWLNMNVYLPCSTPGSLKVQSLQKFRAPRCERTRLQSCDPISLTFIGSVTTITQLEGRNFLHRFFKFALLPIRCLRLPMIVIENGLRIHLTATRSGGGVRKLCIKNLGVSSLVHSALGCRHSVLVYP